MSVEAATIVLLPGPVKAADRVGHHDYLGGCALLAGLLEQTPGVRAVLEPGGWPTDESLLDAAHALVFYTRGGKQPFLRSPQRIERVQKLVDRGVGLVMIHQAVCYPRDFASRAKSWLGGVHVAGEADRGHWRTQHRELPEHPAARGVPAWTIRDGWLREIQFVDGMDGITPLVWSGRKHRGSSRGGPADVVSWAYDRPEGGRSFCFTGIDAHSAWSLAGVRQLMVNGVLWSTGKGVPECGAPCLVDERELESYLTPRHSRSRRALAAARSLLRRGREGVRNVV